MRDLWTRLDIRYRMSLPMRRRRTVARIRLYTGRTIPRVGVPTPMDRA